MNPNSKIFIAGAHGMVGSALVRELNRTGYHQLYTPTRQDLDLFDDKAVQNYFATYRPEYVFIAAAKVGGIHANKTYPVDFITENLRIELNVIANAHRAGVRKLLFLGSSCIYPRLAEQPIRESDLLKGPVEPTNFAYSIAKISGVALCQSYRQQYGSQFFTAVPTGTYGPRDNYHPENSHVIPGLIRRFHQAKIDQAAEVVVWGTGTPLREFVYVEDLANACVFLMQKDLDLELINIGSNEEIQIKDLANLVASCVGYKGRIVFDKSQPDGTPRKILNSENLFNLGWRPSVSLKEGLARAYQDFLSRSK